jgi:hypothetical protein
MLGSSGDTNKDRNNLHITSDTAQGNKGTLEFEKQRAEGEFAIAQLEVDRLNTQAQQNKDMLSRHQLELASKPFTLTDFVSTV